MDLKEIAVNKNNKRHPWEVARIRVIVHQIKTLVKDTEKAITILDIGSGDTFLIRQLSKIFENACFFAVDTAYDEDYLMKSNQEFQKKKSKNSGI